MFVETANSRATLTEQASEAVVAAQSVATAENALADTKQHFDSTKDAWRSVALWSESELAVLLKSAASVLEEVDKLERAIVSEKTAIAGTAAERAREHCAGIRTAGSIVQSVHETIACCKDEASAAVKRAGAAVATVSVGCVIVPPVLSAFACDAGRGCHGTERSTRREIKQGEGLSREQTHLHRGWAGGAGTD